ncbi:hypothetical protein [Accumulibacter sp.]|uniref:hypothetical protein n=1 Tax=Accumulibacter sp. TaxID=2053492 RepID=UPI001AD0D48B|nr:hypothetical protein [Accumulibacter sp.]MBN8453873.1 hypothetical protein [Accumulibacter sp.]
MLDLTTLAPDIVAAILDATLPQHVTVHELAISPPVLWGGAAGADRCGWRGDAGLIACIRVQAGVVVKSVWLANSSLTAKKSELHPSYSVR